MIATISISFAEPLRPANGLPVEKCKHIIIGKVKDIRAIPLFDGKLLSAEEIAERSKDKKQKVGLMLYTGFIIVEKTTKGDMKMGTKVPVVWTDAIIAKATGEIGFMMCRRHHVSVPSGVTLQFGLMSKAPDGKSWRFMEAALQKQLSNQTK